MKLTEILNKYVTYVLYILLVLSFIGNIRSCSTNKDISKTKRNVEILSNKIDSLTNVIYSKEQLNVRISIEGYEISKRMLYDQNAIVRTVTRPDDRMREYDLKIKELEEKLK